MIVPEHSGDPPSARPIGQSGQAGGTAASQRARLQASCVV